MSFRFVYLYICIFGRSTTGPPTHLLLEVQSQMGTLSRHDQAFGLFVKTAECFKSTLFLSCCGIKHGAILIYGIKKTDFATWCTREIKWHGQTVGVFVETAELFRSKGAHRQSFSSCGLEKVGSHTGGKILSM